MAFVTTTSPDLYATTSNLEEIPAGAEPLEYADDAKLNQILVGLTALHGWASGVPVSETANGHFLALAAGSSAAVSVAAGVRIRQSSGALDYSYNTGAYARLLSKLTLASQATGDIMYASAADTWTRLGVGTNGHVLTLSGGVPVWAAGGGGGGIAAGDNVTWTGNHAWNTGTAAFANSLGVTGTLTVTGGATISTTLGLAAGAAATPSLYATGDTNTGWYFPAADQIGLATAGTARVIIDSSTILTGLILTGPAGSASLPTYGFTGDPNTGAYNIGADQYGITAGGTLRFTVSTTALTSTLPVLGANGSAAAPTFGFSGDAGEGLYLSAANTPAMAAAGVISADFGATAVRLYSSGALYHQFNATSVTLKADTATTNGLVSSLDTKLHCTGTAAVGFGIANSRYLDNASGTETQAAYDSIVWTNATAASETTDWAMALRSAGSLVERGRLTGAGAWQVGAGSASLPSHSFTADTNTGWYSEGADQMNASLGGTQRHKIGTTYARYALNGGVFKDTSAFEVIVGGVGADGRGRFENNISSTGVSGIIATNDNSWSGTMLIDGSSTTRTGVAGNAYFVGLSTQAHFGALTNTDSHWITGTADSTADRVASAIYNAGNRYLKIGYFVEYTEMSAPAAGAADTARVFAVDNGSGKTVLKCQFATGAAQTMATEP